jgi:hypothetical protein
LTQSGHGPYLSRLFAFSHETIFRRSVQRFTFFAHGLAFAGVLLTFSYEASFGRAMKWLTSALTDGRGKGVQKVNLFLAGNVRN